MKKVFPTGCRRIPSQPLASRRRCRWRPSRLPEAKERNRDEYLRRIDGLMIGDNPKDGVVRGNAFLHPVMRFAMEFPEGWDVINTPDQVAAQETGQPHYMLLQLVDRPQGNTAEEIAARSMTAAGFRHSDGQPTNLGGLDAYVGLYQGQINGVGRVMMRAAHVIHGRQVYVLAGFAPEAEFAKVDRTIAESIRTFRELSAARSWRDSCQSTRLLHRAGRRHLAINRAARGRIGQGDRACNHEWPRRQRAADARRAHQNRGHRGDIRQSPAHALSVRKRGRSVRARAIRLPLR